MHHPVDEQPQPDIGRHPPRAGMRRGEQTPFLQFWSTLRIEAGDRLIPDRAIVFDPTGWPLVR